MKCFRAASAARRSHRRRPRANRASVELTRMHHLAAASPAIAPLLTPPEWSRLMRCSTEMRNAVRKTRPSMEHLNPAQQRRELFDHWMTAGWPYPAQLCLWSSVGAEGARASTFIS